MNARAIFLLVSLAAASAGCSPESRPSEEADGVSRSRTPVSVLGVWEPTEVIAGGSGGADLHVTPAVGPAGPGLRIFTPQYYAYVGINSVEPRIPPPATGATAADLMAAWGPVGASVGPYEVVGDTIVMHPTAEKTIPPPGVTKVTRLTFRVSGDSLWLTNLRFAETVKYIRRESWPSDQR